VVDNTTATPYLVRPLEQGADVVVVSATKYYGGHGSSLGGVVIDGGSFDWRAQRDGQDLYPSFTTPDPAYHGLVYADLGAPALALKTRVTLLRHTGAAPGTFSARTNAPGRDTRSLGVERHGANAHKISEWLEARDDVAPVSVAGLAPSPRNEIQKRISREGAGAIITFDLAAPQGAS